MLKSRPLNPFLKKSLKMQFLRPISRCETYKCYCRFAIPMYCLEEFKPFACEFAGTISKSNLTFGKKEVKKDETLTNCFGRG